MSPRQAAKRLAQGSALVATLIPALLTGLGRLEPAFEFFAHFYALMPGIPGNFLRAAFYRYTLSECSINTNIGFGTFFVHPGASVGEFVSIGSYCVIGRARIGARTQIASHVEITSGRHQHERDAEGRLSGSIHALVAIGASCWVGSSAIIMADIGEGTTIGAGAVVVREIPASVVAVGNPARVIRTLGRSEAMAT